MDQLIVNASIILISCLISACFTIFALRFNNKDTAGIMETRELSAREEIQALLDTTFAEYKPLISRSMTLAANAGAQAKKVQAFEREVIRAVQDDLPISPEMITSFSPRLGEMIEENPELLIKGQQILQKILGEQGLLNTSGTSRRPIERRREE